MRKCLIVIDYQNDFVCGTLGFPKAAELEGRILGKIHQYRAEDADVIFTLDTHFEDYLSTFEGRRLPIPHCVEGTDGHKLYGRVAEARKESDIVYTKMTFGSDALFEHLKRVEYSSIELVGLVSDICVVANAVLARTAQPETEIIVAADCIASANEEANEAALCVMKSLQINVIMDSDKGKQCDMRGDTE